jgi:hypothetical protein
MAQETQVVDLLNSSAAHDTVRKGTTIPVVPTIRTMSLDPNYRGTIQLTTPIFFSRALDRGLIVISGDSWATDVKELDSVQSLGSVLLKVSDTDSSNSVVELEEGLVLIALKHGHATLTAAGHTSESVTELLARVRAIVPAKVSKSDTVSIGFLSAESGISRSLVVPTWNDIKTNYPASLQEKLGCLIDLGSKQSGRLLLWHGLPGTGKTYALRALAKEWQGWCDVQYILDPERFFGAGTEYMMDVLLSRSGTKQVDGQPRWRLLIAEDTGELLAKDAKTQVGQGLSRLLNMVDGLIGQGLQTMVLITTNEKLEGMHDAVTRPGRTGSVIEFLPFAPDEANEWLRRNGKAAIDDRKARTLAELFAGARPQRASIGFVPDGLRKTA